MTNFLSHPLLSIQYDALCIRLAALIKTQPTVEALDMHLALIDKTLDDAIKINDELLEIYTKSGVHLTSQQDGLRAQKRRLLFFKNKPETTTEPPNFTHLSPVPNILVTSEAKQSSDLNAAGLLRPEAASQRQALHKVSHLPHASKKFRTETGLWNQLRQFLARSWRFFLNIPTVLVTAGQNAEGFIKGLELAAQGIRPIMNYLSWLFLLPRLLLNLFEFGKHLAHPKGLNRPLVFKLEFQERWFELANDLFWVPAGLLGCFLLVGSLSYAGVALTVALVVWDLLMAGIRAGFELNRLHTVINAEKAKLEDDQLAPELHLEQQNYINTLKAHQRYERKRHLISISNALVVTIGTILALSLFTVAPWLALLGACLLMTASIATYVLGTHVIKRPENPLMGIPIDALAPMRERQAVPSDTHDPTIAATHPTPPPALDSLLDLSILRGMQPDASGSSNGLSDASSPYSVAPTPRAPTPTVAMT